MSITKQTAAAKVLHPLAQQWRAHLTGLVLLRGFTGELSPQATRAFSPAIQEKLKAIDLAHQDLSLLIHNEGKAIQDKMAEATKKFLEVMYGRPQAVAGRTSVYWVPTLVGDAIQVEITGVDRVQFHNDLLHSFAITYAPVQRRGSSTTDDVIYRNERFVLDQD